MSAADRAARFATLDTSIVADVLDGLGLRAVLPNIAILSGSGLLLLVLSAFLWQRRLLRGELA